MEYNINDCSFLILYVSLINFYSTELEIQGEISISNAGSFFLLINDYKN